MVEGDHKVWDYRDILRTELQRRCRQNPSYSQSAFARDLDILPSRLSEVLGGKQGLSGLSARMIAERLGFRDEECSFFVDLVLFQHGRSKSVREGALRRLKIDRAKLEYFDQPEERSYKSYGWYHFAMLSLAEYPNRLGSIDHTSKVFDLNPEVVRQALTLLINLGQVEKNGRCLKRLSHNRPTPYVLEKSREEFALYTGIKVLSDGQNGSRELCLTEPLLVKKSRKEELLKTLHKINQELLSEIESFRSDALDHEEELEAVSINLAAVCLSSEKNVDSD